MAAPRAPRRAPRGPAGLLLALAVASVVAGWLTTPRPLHAQASALVPVAAAYTAAWNAHDLDAVLARFAPDAVVRERRGDVPLVLPVPPAVGDTHDPQVVRAYLEDSQSGETYDTHGLTRATGHAQIGAWAAARFAQHHRVVAGQHRTAGETVGWHYWAFVDPYQLLPGVPPTEGAAEAVVRGGRITRLSLVISPASVQRQWDEVDAFLERARAAPPGARASVPLRGPPRTGSGAEPAPVGWPLALGGLALLGVFTMAQRRRRGGTGAAERNRTIPGTRM